MAASRNPRVCMAMSLATGHPREYVHGAVWPDDSLRSGWRGWSGMERSERPFKTRHMHQI